MENFSEQILKKCDQLKNLPWFYISDNSLFVFFAKNKRWQNFNTVMYGIQCLS